MLSGIGVSRSCLKTSSKARVHSLHCGILLYISHHQVFASGHTRGHAMASSNDGVVMHVTAPDKKVASMLASRLVEEKLAACVQTISGVESTYVWQGKVETEAEHLLLIKTQQSHIKKVAKLVEDLHPYDVPEAIATPITGGSEKYLQWLKDTTAPGK